MKIPVRVDEPIELAKKYGKRFILQNFKNPDGTMVEFALFTGKNDDMRTSIVLPVTEDATVLAIRQFRHGANEIVLEVPGGNPKVPNEPPQDVIARELEEETGYRAKEIILLNNGMPIWWEPCSVQGRLNALLAKGCYIVGEQELDATEQIELVKVPLAEWLKMIYRGEIRDAKTLAVTLLALPHLGMHIS